MNLSPEQVEELFDAASTVVTLANQAELFLHHKFPPELNRALTQLSKVTGKLEPVMKGLIQARGIIKQVIAALGEDNLQARYLQEALKSLDRKPNS